jgi:hypothetical protein
MFSRNIEFRKVSRTIIASLICANIWGGQVASLNSQLRSAIPSIQSLFGTASAITELDKNVKDILTNAQEYMFGNNQTKIAVLQTLISKDSITIRPTTTEGSTTTATAAPESSPTTDTSRPVADFFSKLFFGISADQRSKTGWFPCFLLLCVFPLWMVKSIFEFIFEFINNLLRFDFSSYNSSAATRVDITRESFVAILESLNIQAPATCSDKLTSIWLAVKALDASVSDPASFAESKAPTFDTGANPTVSALQEINKLLGDFNKLNNEEKTNKALIIAALLMKYPYCRLADIVILP